MQKRKLVEIRARHLKIIRILKNSHFPKIRFLRRLRKIFSIWLLLDIRFSSISCCFRFAFGIKIKLNEFFPLSFSFSFHFHITRMEQKSSHIRIDFWYRVSHLTIIAFMLFYRFHTSTTIILNTLLSIVWKI